MNGYSWSVLCRMTPTNGPEDVEDLSSAGFGLTVMTKAGLRYREELERRTTINRTERPLLFGFRPELVLRFEMLDMTHYNKIAKIQTRLMDPSWAVEFSLDGGNSYREMELKKAASPLPLRDKTIAGAAFVLEMRSKHTWPDAELIQTGTGW